MNANWLRDVPPLSRQKIADMAEGITREFCLSFYPEEIDRRLIGLDFDVIYKHLLRPKYNLQMQFDVELGCCEFTGRQVMGKYLPFENLVLIDPSVVNSPQYVFTCWHEIAHALLHGPWLRSVMQTKRIRREVATTDSGLSASVSQLFEWQANQFAARGAAPDWLLVLVIRQTFGEPFRPFIYDRPGKYCFEVNGISEFRLIDDYDHLCRTVASFIQPRFGWLSKEALGYRLADLRWTPKAGQAAGRF